MAIDNRQPAVIFGATGTIGSQLARCLVEDGRPVVLVARNPEKLRLLGQQLDQPFIVSNFECSESLEENLKEVLGEGLAPQAMVNCIGSILLKAAHLTSDTEFRETIETNLFTSFLCVKLAGKLMREKGGSVVLFASAASEIGISNHEAIAAAKAGVVGLARSAAATYASSNLRFNVISPGLVQTEMTRRLWQNETSAKASRQMHALGRLGEPQHITSCLRWLVAPENDWITGQCIGIDGGLGHVLSRR
jgi:3-oxoacyl-[acyl-carrier protein] reductase